MEVYTKMKHVRIAAMVLAVCLLVVCQSVALAQNLGAAPQVNVAVQGQTGAQPEGAFLNFVNWVGNVIAPVGAGVAVVGGIVSYASGRVTSAGSGRSGTPDRVRSDPIAGVLDRAGHRRCFLGSNHDGGANGSAVPPFARHLSRSFAMNLINDGIGLLLGLAPVAALVALVLAGLALRNQSSVLQNGRFGLWMFWAAVMLTLPQILSWFSGFGHECAHLRRRGYGTPERIPGGRHQFRQPVRGRLSCSRAGRVAGPSRGR